MQQAAEDRIEISGAFESRQALMNALEGVGVAHDHRPMSDGPFRTDITRRRVGHFIFGDIRIDPCTSSRGPGHLKSASEEYICITAIPLGRTHFVQKSEEFTVECGEVFIWNANFPSQAEHNVRCIGKTIMIPIALAERKISSVSEIVGLKSSVGDPLSDLIYRHLMNFHNTLEMIPIEKINDLVMSTIDLSICCLPSSAYRNLPTSYQSELFKRSINYIKSHITDDRLSLVDVANTIGISTRSLQKIFANANTSFGGFVRNERLQQSAKAMVSPSMKKVSVTEIAYRFGFFDLSHFSRLFKYRFGVSPQYYRSQILGSVDKRT